MFSFYSGDRSIRHWRAVLVTAQSRSFGGHCQSSVDYAEGLPLQSTLRQTSRAWSRENGRVWKKYSGGFWYVASEKRGKMTFEKKEKRHFILRLIGQGSTSATNLEY